jgi:hypothetical protein
MVGLRTPIRPSSLGLDQCLDATLGAFAEVSHPAF